MNSRGPLPSRFFSNTAGRGSSLPAAVTTPPNCSQQPPPAREVGAAVGKRGVEEAVVVAEQEVDPAGAVAVAVVFREVVEVGVVPAVHGLPRRPCRWEWPLPVTLRLPSNCAWIQCWYGSRRM